jgi:hypothetical protein
MAAKANILHPNREILNNLIGSMENKTLAKKRELIPSSFFK